METRSHKSTLTVLLILFVGISSIAVYQILVPAREPNLKLEALRLKFARDEAPVVDHSQFPELQREFKTPMEVTQACINCHNTRHLEVMESAHWNWDRIGFSEERGITAIGKRNTLNNYCIGVGSNEGSCASCHVGLGMARLEDFDFEEPTNVDCLSCHAGSEFYEKGAGLGGAPATTVDLGRAAVSVGRPTITNCGTCHFNGGGGNNVKHGDLEVALYHADRNLDVHLAKDGIQMTCVDCHTANNHEIKGKLYSVSSNNVNRLLCEDCHTSTPHLTEMLNLHSAKVACQTCHIPVYAKENPTKMSWRWSDAGHLGPDGKPLTLSDSLGDNVYLSTKGTFTWASDVTPEYVWFNGNAEHYYLGDKIDTSAGPVQMNRLLGSYHDPDSKIIPVKVHRGDQIYDTEHLTLIQPKLASAEPGDSAFWKEFNWKTAAEAGMKEVGLPFSGYYAFTETEMYWPINHMVSPGTMALTCNDCHTPTNGRLAALDDFYLPGRDRSEPLDTAGWLLIGLSLGAVVLHAGARTYIHLKTHGLS
jgi:octaheme c-type cytochrome (tetrathionate reductase family)